MRRPGCDEDNLEMADFLCDFCGSVWIEDLPMVEGHKGSCICGKCLTVAYTGVVLGEAGSAPEGYQCTLCLEKRPEHGWASPVREEASICRRCIKQCAGVLSKDKETPWTRPG
jgi:hypothetical protein